MVLFFLGKKDDTPVIYTYNKRLQNKMMGLPSKSKKLKANPKLDTLQPTRNWKTNSQPRKHQAEPRATCRKYGFDS